MQQYRFSLMDQTLSPSKFTYKELNKLASKNFSRSELLGSGGYGAVNKGTRSLSSGFLVDYVKCMSHYAIDNWRMGILQMAIFLVWAAATAPLSALAQQQYHSPQGYNCNGRDRTCSTYALYRTFQAQESMAKVADYFNTTPARVANVSGLSDLPPNAALPQGQALYIPLDCSCAQSNVTSQMQVKHTIVSGDTFAQLAMTIYGGLTTFEALMVWNPAKDVYNLNIGDTIKVPIFCACPTVSQIESGTNFLLTYTVYRDETLDVISGYFGITAGEMSSANKIPFNETTRLVESTTLLVPLETLPPIPTMGAAHVTISPTSNFLQRSKAGIIPGVSAGVVAVLLVAGLFIARCRRKTSSKKQDKLSEFSLVDQKLVPRMFTFQELSKATKNFRRSKILGTGGFGAVYKGTLPSGALVAVKRMRIESKHGEESFRAEVASLNRIRHRNLLQLRGWCHEEEQLLLVYDYMCNGSLDEWLLQFPKCREKGIGKGMSNLKDAEALPLKLRHSILSGVASALSYLHEDCAQCVLHRDIKSSNVLLDGELNAYLGDFGLARLIDHQKMARTTMMAGTLGYLAPEMPHTGKATKETDVFSFGILMLEVMCGMQPLDVTAIELGEGVLEDRVWQAHETGNILQVADSRLGSFSDSDPNSSSYGGFESPEESSNLTNSTLHDVDPSEIYFAPDGAVDDRKMITNLLHLGLLCCHPNPEDRPSMRQVSHLMLQPLDEMEMSMPCLPEWKPQVLYSRSRFRGFSQVL